MESADRILASIEAADIDESLAVLGAAQAENSRLLVQWRRLLARPWPWNLYRADRLGRLVQARIESADAELRDLTRRILALEEEVG